MIRRVRFVCFFVGEVKQKGLSFKLVGQPLVFLGGSDVAINGLVVAR